MNNEDWVSLFILGAVAVYCILLVLEDTIRFPWSPL